MDIFDNNSHVKLSYFDTKEEAITEYIRHKEAAIIAKADYYKGRIPKKLYDIMVSWKLELSDWDKNQSK